MQCASEAEDHMGRWLTDPDATVGPVPVAVAFIKLSSPSTGPNRGCAIIVSFAPLRRPRDSFSKRTCDNPYPSVDSPGYGYGL